MRIGAVVQARMGSERLPGKVLRSLNGRPLLSYLLDRLQHAADLDDLLVATSDEPEDDELAAFCTRLGVPCFRDSLNDVAGRFLNACEAHGLDAFVRVNGDSPLLDQRIVDRGVEVFREAAPDLATNVFPRRCPIGQSVEVVSRDALRSARPLMTDEDREHVTLAFYSHANRFDIVSFEFADIDYGGISLAVDTPEDARLVAAVMRRMERPHWDYGLEEILALRTAAGP